MAFVSQLFLPHSNHSLSRSSNHGLLLVRPMLEFFKDDMYEICRGGNKMWVEDPTNQSIIFARNRVRIALRNLPSPLWSEMQALISTCRLTRSFADHFCLKMFEHSVTVMDEGYIIIDLEKLNPPNVDDFCLSKFLAMILQFVSQRRSPVRGSVKKLLLEYIRKLPCKTSFTAAGCYLCAAPRSKGMKAIVCYSPESPFSSKLLLPNIHHGGHSSPMTDQIIRDAKLHSDKLVVKAAYIPFLHAKCSEDILREALQLELITESTYTSICMLQMEEREKFCSQIGLEQTYDSQHQTTVSSSNVQLYPGLWHHFMCRFLVTWKHHEGSDAFSSNLIEFTHNSDANVDTACQYCGISRESSLIIRHMVEADWLYLAELLKDQTSPEDIKLQTSNYTKSSAQVALKNLRPIPAAARRALPVFVGPHNILICIPSIGFKCCPCLDIVAEFRPRVPFGGGYSSYL